MTNDPSIPRIGHLIQGHRRHAEGRTQPIFNPATGAVIRKVELADLGTVDAAVESAAAAYAGWRRELPTRRARIMRRLLELVDAQREPLCQLLTQEHGKTLQDAHGELQRGLENLEYAVAAPELLKGEHSREAGHGIDSWSQFASLGVVAGITPFNFPAMVPLWMWPLAVVCGNAFVLKPSERDPSVALAIAELALEAGLPAGVLNVINGDAATAAALIADSRVRAVSFVGSTPVAEQIYRAGCAAGKRVQALGGAKNHAVVLPDADLDAVVSSLLGAAFGSAGERCMAISVVVAVGDALADALIARLKTAVEALRLGPGDAPDTDIGPLITREHRARVARYVDVGVQEGAALIADGRPAHVAGHEEGFFLGPCLFDQVKPYMRIYREEIFGPVLSLVRVADEAEATALVNAHEFGNGVCIYTGDGGAARRFVEEVEAGMVGINVPLPVPVANHSFGGWKRSLFGDLAAYGPDGVRFYTRRKTVSQRWPDAKIADTPQFTFPSHR